MVFSGGLKPWKIYRQRTQDKKIALKMFEVCESDKKLKKKKVKREIHSLKFWCLCC
jgi:hypothetical protein